MEQMYRGWLELVRFTYYLEHNQFISSEMKCPQTQSQASNKIEAYEVAITRTVEAILYRLWFR